VKRSIVLVAFALGALLGCDKKDASSQGAASSASASGASGAAAPAAPSAAVSPEPAAEPSPVPDPVKVAATATAPAEPNAPPPHDEHVQAATNEIHKDNYKSELEALEKEDLTADRK
jgi:hypothetical protein